MASLEPVYRKLRRAEKDLTTLRDELKAFDESEPQSVVQEIDPNDGSIVVRLRALRAFDPEWEITVGEIAYQMRSALDQLVAQLVALEGGDPDAHRGTFPIYKSAELYWQERKPRGGGPKRTVRDVALEGVAASQKKIVDALQPFQRGTADAERDPLWVLSETCNADKHKRGHPARWVLRRSFFTEVNEKNREVRVFARDYGPARDLLPDRGQPVADGAEVVRLGGPKDTSNLPLQDRLGPAGLQFAVAFGPALVRWPELKQILDYVDSKVVARFQPAFERHE